MQPSLLRTTSIRPTITDLNLSPSVSSPSSAAAPKMRTRKSNKTKSFKAQTYDFDGDISDDADAGNPPQADRDGDGDFDMAVADQEESPDEDPDPEISPGESSAGGNEPTGATSTKSHAKKVSSTGQEGSTAYFGVGYNGVPSRKGVPMGYAGIPDRHIRGVNLVHHWYGPQQDTVNRVLRLLDEYLTVPYLPIKEQPRAVKKGFWDEGLHEREASHADSWLRKVHQGSSQVLKPLSNEEAAPWRPAPGSLPTMSGTYNEQPEWNGCAFDSTVISKNGKPLNLDQDVPKEAAGWLIDTGGLVLDLSWATRRSTEAPQWLALAAIPHSDQEVYNYEQEATRPDFQKQGTVQIWEFKGSPDESSKIRPASVVARAKKMLCFNVGRAKRVEWSPTCEHLAIICGGNVYVLDPKVDEQGFYVKVDHPIAHMALEDGIEAMSLAWVAYNRLVIGYGDGSIAHWSVFPARMLSRHAMHHSAVISIATGYPSKPFSIASTPLGGHLKLFDLRNPSCETTEMLNLSVTTQPGLLDWCDHHKGFFSLLPSSAIINTTIGFAHHDYFPVMRRIATLESLVTCLAIGKTHPFMLVGGLDGTLTAMNPQFEIFQLHQTRYERADKLKVFQHEHRPRENSRGASRILHGFKPEKNQHVSVKSRQPPKSKAQKHKKRKKGSELVEDDDDDDDERGDNWIKVREPKRGVVHEPLTRITAVEWNPNQGHGTWAAAAMGCGLVKVMDLGLEPQ